jgi:hypothetical protein
MDEHKNDSIKITDHVLNLDYIWLALITPMIIFASVTNGINSFIFSNSKLKDKIYTYFFINSTTETFYFFLMIPGSFPYSTSVFDISITNSYASIFYSLYIDQYLTSCLAMFNLTIEISTSLRRYLTISNSRRLKWFTEKSPYHIATILLVMSLFYYMPVLLIYNIKPLNTTGSADSKHQNLYTLDKGQNIAGVLLYLEIILNVFKGVICVTILIIINLLALLKFRKQMSVKTNFKNGNVVTDNSNSTDNQHELNEIVPVRVKTLKKDNSNLHNSTSEAKANRNITKMVLSLLIVYIFGYVPRSLRIILQRFNIENHSPTFFPIFFLLENFLLISTHGCQIFIYLFSNKLYRVLFYEYLKKIFKID